MRTSFLAGLAALLMAAAPASADIVSGWVELAGRSPDGRPSLAPPQQDQTQRSAPALVALAAFEAANRADPRYRSWLGLAPAPGASGEAAVAQAAHDVLVSLLPAERVRLDQALELSLASIPDSAERSAGIALGTDTAAAVLKRNLFAGAEPEPYRPRSAPGEFAPPMPSLMAPWALRAQPLFLKSFDEVMPPAPPALTSERYARDLNETRTLGGIDQPGATPLAKTLASFLGGFNMDPMIERAAAAKPRLVDRARFWALVRMAQHDSNAATAAAKMKYQAWRPWNAIRNADRDDNPATTRDPLWEPVLTTPNHPEYPCGHCIASGLIATLLEPETRGPITVASDSMPWTAGMVFPDWPSFRAATSLARIQGGMHFRFSNEAGQEMGRKIALLARERFAPPLAR